MRVQTKSGKRTMGLSARRHTFMKLVEKMPSGCWHWIGSTIHSGYGQVTLFGYRTTAHRAAYRLFVGSVPSDMNICHSCDNRRCVNPSHLWIGTQNDDIQDMRRKGRERKAVGEAHPHAKLTERQVREIRSDPRGPSVLAPIYSVATSSITNIRKRRKWRHI